MAQEMNLVPEGAKTNSSSLKLVNQIRTLDIIGTIIFFLGVFLLTAFIVINSQELKSLQKRQEALKTSINKLKTVEEQYVKVKDRADKIEKILAERTVMTALTNFDSLKSQLPADIVYSQLEITLKDTELSLNSPTYSSLSQTLATVISSGYYKEIILTSFTFNSKTGYAISFKLAS